MDIDRIRNSSVKSINRKHAEVRQLSASKSNLTASNKKTAKENEVRESDKFTGPQSASDSRIMSGKDIQKVIMKTGEEKVESPKPNQLFKALKIRHNLETLKGEDKEKYIQEFREKNTGKIFVSLDLHNHQPIYRPGVHPADTPEIQQYVLGTGDADNRREVYKDADAYAVEEMKGNPDYPHFGFQVSYSGSLMENLEKTKERGLWPGEGWNERYKNLRQVAKTVMENPQLDLVNIGYHHPLMGLIASGHTGADGNVNEDKDIELQLKMHQYAVDRLFGKPISKGFFPPEMAFSERMIPAIKKAGIEWTMVDNIHFDRANQDYNNPQDGLKPPNKADKRNPGKHDYETLPNDLAKTHIVSPDALRPHYIKHIDPMTGNEELMVVVPEERSLSSYIQKDRDGHKLQEIIDKFDKHNTDPDHPIFVLYATDGDNNGSNSGEFHRNVPVDMATRFPGKVVFTTIQDYLDLFPPEKPELVSNENGVKKYSGGDVIHVEDGAWWGANLGDPQFSKWIDDPGYKGYSPKNNSWAVLTAAKNEVLTADSLEPAGETKESIGNIVNRKGSETEKAWHDLLVGQTSCYEYWNPDNILSYSSVKGANMAVENARKVIERNDGKEKDKVGPSIFLPMHSPYNPKGFPSSFNVVTYAYDLNDIKSINVKYRKDADGILNRPEDFMYEGEGVSTWDGKTSMINCGFPDLENKPDVWVDPTIRADRYEAKIEPDIEENKEGEIIQYYVEAEDSKGNISRSPIRNVYVQNKPENPENITNEEIHNGLKSGDQHQVANTVSLVLNIGRNDFNVFNHLFFRLEQANPEMMQNLEMLAGNGKISLNENPDFRNEYINRLDKHLVKEENITSIKERPDLSKAMSHPLSDMSSDPRVKRILEKIG
ncbi:MAG: hypothetical protein K8T10_12580 [Candidatus Eremiobacteraeota bacterium]|nr:hypothetical protein [Candidatus Eremiobacteraeota bacterium]